MDNTVKYLLKELEDLGAWVYHISKYGSVYIKFEDEKLRSLRVADHPGRKKYKYKWNLMTKGGIRNGLREEVDRGVNRFYYSPDKCKDLVTHIRSYKRKIDEN